MATTPAPQRRWQALCPNCGAPVEFASAASACAVCSFCRSTLLRDGESLRKIGNSAELIEDYSPLQLGAAGHYAGEAFTIVGRLQYRYADGGWNEWHALFDAGGRSAWLSEDNGSFVMAFDAPLGQAAPSPESLRLGAGLALAGSNWSVAALTTASLAAAQGELPRPPALGQEFLVAELRNERDEVGTLDYSQPQSPQWSIGRPVHIADLRMSGLREAGGAKAVAGSRALSCPNCGASLEPRLGTTVSIVCPQCQHVVDLSQGVGAELKHFAQAHGGEPQIALGSIGSLAYGGGAALAWQVVGYQERCDIPAPGDDEETTFWREYLLYNASEGFVFLVDAEDGWSLVRPLTGAPTGSGATVQWQARSYRRKYAYAAKTTYVLGEFYWQLQRDERAQVVDYESTGGGRKLLLSREQTAQEVTWSQGGALDAADVARAFGLAVDRIPALQRDAAPTLSPGRILRWMIVIFVVLPLLLVLVRACSRDDCQAYADSFGSNSAEYLQCRRSSGGGAYYGGGSGGSYGGYSSGGGGHK
ncbi:DUF4178 domain-containing protein [Pelomonas sp. KK5]|uniref:DUF4178 domain-containing protein n=1 Tax=Pelomonas sp. KK5 TaxID=1855730 RepID=UPI00097CA650|nr:DUF4178 domain-containing protein [Pelomonas sp. KK5]